MRWIKHLSASGRDEKIMALKDNFGMEGYGVYWSILETIAEQMTPENDQCFIELSVKNWRKVTDFSPKKLNNYLTFLSEISLIFSDFRENSIKVTCPNLLKYRDEYNSRKTKKSGVSTDKVGSNTKIPFVSASVSDSVSNYQGEDLIKLDMMEVNPF